MPFVEPVKKKRLPRRFPIYVLVAIIVLSLIALIVSKATRPSLPFSLSDYEKALRKGEYSRVYTIYNDTRLKRSELAGRSQNETILSLLRDADELIGHIESDAKNRSEDLLTRVFNGTPLTDEEVAYIELDAAIAGATMTSFIEEKTNRYLFGEIDENVYLTFMAEMARVPIFSQEYSQVIEKTESLRQVRVLEGANSAAREGSHYGEAENVRRFWQNR